MQHYCCREVTVTLLLGRTPRANCVPGSFTKEWHMLTSHVLSVGEL